MKVRVEFGIDEKNLEDLGDFLLALDLVEAEPPAQDGEKGSCEEEATGIDVRIGFDWVYCDRRGMQVPKLVNLAIHGYGWIIGGSYDSDIERRVLLPLPKGLADTINRNNYTRHGPLPRK